MLKLLKAGDEIRNPNQDDEQPDNDSSYPIMVPPTPLSENIDNIEKEEVERLELGKTDKDQLYDQRRTYEAEVSVYRAVERLKDIKGIVLHSLKYTVSNRRLFTDYSVDEETGAYLKSGSGSGRNTEGECDILFMGDNYFVIIEVKANPDDIHGGRIQCLRRELLIEAIFRKMQSSESLGRIREPKIRPKIIKCVAIPLCVECEKSDEVTSVTNEDGECKPNPIHTCTSEDNPQQKKVYVLCEEGTPGSKVHTCPRNNKEYTVYKEKDEVKGKDVCTGLADYISGTHLKDDNAFREWWKKNVEPHTQQNSTDPADAYAAELYKKTGDVLIALWRQTMEKKEKTSRRQGSVASLYWNVMKINERLKDGRITYVKNEAVDPSNPNVVKAPEEIKTYIGVKYLTIKQDAIFKRTYQYLWINGPAGSGKTVLLAGRVIQFAKLHPDKKILVVKSMRPRPSEVEFAREKKILVMTNDSESSSIYRTAFDNAGLKFVSSKCERAKILENRNKWAITIVEYKIETYENLKCFDELLQSITEKFDLVVIDCNKNGGGHTDGIRNISIASELQSKYKNIKLAIKEADSATRAVEVVEFLKKPAIYETACKKADIKYRILNKYHKDKILNSIKENTVTIVEDVSIIHHDDFRHNFATSIAKHFDLIVLDDCNGGKSADVNIACISYFFESMKSFSARTRCLIATDIVQRSLKTQSSAAHIIMIAKEGLLKQCVQPSGAEEITSSDDTTQTTHVTPDYFKLIREMEKLRRDLLRISKSLLDDQDVGNVSELYKRLHDVRNKIWQIRMGTKNKRSAPFITLFTLDENLRNTIDISDFTTVVRNMSDERTDLSLTIMPENKEVYHPKQTRGHFIRGSLPIIHVFEEYKVDNIRKVMGSELNKLKNANRDEVAVIYENEELKKALPVNTADHDVTVCTVEECVSSEWPAAIVLFNAMRKDRDEYDTALNRLYTAVSRARVHCVVLFFPDQENVKISDEMYDMEDLLQRLEPFALRKNHNS